MTLVGILQHISTQEIEEEKKTQATLTAELVNLTGILKEATLQMSTSVVKQNKVSLWHEIYDQQG